MRDLINMALALGALAAVMAAPTPSRAETILTPEAAKVAAANPIVAEALAAAEATEAAILAQDLATFSAHLAEDVVVNTPGNSAHDRSGVLRFFGAGAINYKRFDRTIELVQARGDAMVVLMGAELLEPIGKNPQAGSTLHRRFTDVWRKESDGMWRLTIRQSTIIRKE